MALAVGHRKKEVRTGLHMNFLFFLMSLVVLIVVGVSMWKDTHPEWLSYQEQFMSLERRVLRAKEADLIRQINHPSYDQDYRQAQQTYLAAKAKFDGATSILENTEADLEEMEVRLQGAEGPEEGGQPGTGAATGTTKPGSEASKGELDELDKEFSSGSGAKAASPSKTSKKELDDLDKEFAEPGTKKGTNPKTVAPPAETGSASPSRASKKELDDLDKEFAEPAPKKGSKPKPAAPPVGKGSASEMDELDKEFADGAKKGGGPSHGSKMVAAGPSDQATYSEADLTVDQTGAEFRLEAAQRDLIIAKRTHDREMLGLPADADLKRQLSEAKLKEANETLDVASAAVTLESAKATVKTAAQVARWAVDVSTLNELRARDQVSSLPAARAKQLQESEADLKAQNDQLRRDLRLVQSRLSGNSSGQPEIEQIFVDRLGAIDRCTTCHKAVEEPGFESAREPFRTHSVELLRWHPIERFGCVSCHGGWGNALEKFDAHGGEIGKGKPLLVGDQIQASCGKCHGETRQLAGEESYLTGAQLFRLSGCLGCHKADVSQASSTAGPTTLVYQTAQPKVGPDLDRVAEKIRPSWLVGWLQNPQSHTIDARMPNLGLAKDQADAIATYLLTQHGAAARPSFAVQTASDQRIAQGKRLFQNLGCLGCHVVRGEGAAVGPELTNIRGKVDPQWLYDWVQNPKAFFPNSRMPVFNLTRQQSEDIGNYLLSIGTDKVSPLDVAPDLSDSRAAALGAKLISERGCAGCHDIKGFEKISAPDLTNVGDKTADVLEFGNAHDVRKDLYDYILTKLMNPRAFDTETFKGKMPQFGLSKDDAHTIAIYLMSRTSQELPTEYTRDVQEQSSALLAGRRVFAQHDCSACHRIAGEGGKVGPELTREGEMVQPSWLFQFLKRPSRVRWWQDARMPDFNLSDSEATSLTEFFMTVSNQPAPYEYTPPDQKVFPLALVGSKYFDELKCQSCHPLAGKQGVAGGDTKKLGPDLGMAPTRLKKDWMFRFLRDPQAFSPGTQMPTFGKPDEMYLAIIDFLMKQHVP